jgi:hypothetical protein
VARQSAGQYFKMREEIRRGDRALITISHARTRTAVRWPGTKTGGVNKNRWKVKQSARSASGPELRNAAVHRLFRATHYHPGIYYCAGLDARGITLPVISASGARHCPGDSDRAHLGLAPLSAAHNDAPRSPYLLIIASSPRYRARGPHSAAGSLILRGPIKSAMGRRFRRPDDTPAILSAPLFKAALARFSCPTPSSPPPLRFSKIFIHYPRPNLAKAASKSIVALLPSLNTAMDAKPFHKQIAQFALLNLTKCLIIELVLVPPYVLTYAILIPTRKVNAPSKSLVPH